MRISNYLYRYEHWFPSQMSREINFLKKSLYNSFLLGLNKTNLAAGPPGIILAITTVGNIDPHPLSTMTIPNGSFFVLGTMT